jgi:hypothetical protein
VRCHIKKRFVAAGAITVLSRPSTDSFAEGKQNEGNETTAGEIKRYKVDLMFSRY